MGRPVVVEHEPGGLEGEAAVEPRRRLLVGGVLELHGLEVARVDLHALVDVLRQVDQFHGVLPATASVHDDAGGDVEVLTGDRAAASEARNAQAAATSPASTSRPSGDDVGERGQRLVLGDPAGGGLAPDHLVDPRAGDRARAHGVDPDRRAGPAPARACGPARSRPSSRPRRGCGRAAGACRSSTRSRSGPRAGGDHRRDERAEGEEHAVQVGGDAVAPLGRGDLVQRRRRPRDPGVGDDRVHRAELCAPPRPSPRRMPRPHVARHGHRDAAAVSTSGDRLRERGRVPGGDGHGEAVRGERDGDRPPDARGWPR